MTKKVISIIIVLSLLLQVLIAASMTFTMLKIEAADKLHVKDDTGTYMVLSPQATNSFGQWKEKSNYTGEYLNNTELKITDELGNSYVYTFIPEVAPVTANNVAPINWVAVGVIAGVLLLVVSAISHSTGSSTASGSSGGSMGY